RFLQLGCFDVERTNRRLLPQPRSAAESSMQCMWHVLRHAYGTFQSVARNFLASHRSDDYCPYADCIEHSIEHSFEVNLLREARIPCHPAAKSRRNRYE